MGHPAAQVWQREYTMRLTGAGFTVGTSSPCLFHHRGSDVWVFVHGDDFVASGAPQDISWCRNLLSSFYHIKSTALGESTGCQNVARVLNLTVRWHDGDGISYEADPRHAEAIIKATGVDCDRGVATPGVKVGRNESGDETERDIKNKKKKKTATGALHAKGQLDGAALPSEAVTQYRAVVARGNHFASDRPDIAFAIKEAARHMATPTTESWELMKRVGKYLVTKQRLLWWFKFQDLPNDIVGHSDSDLAGSARTRKSTSGGTVQFGEHLLKIWSRTQDSISLSSAEAELYAGVKCSAEVLAVVSCFADLGLQLESRVMGDASTALGIIRGHGLGQTRHTSTSMLRVQQKHASK